MELFPDNLSQKIGFDAIRKAALEHAVSFMGRERLRRLQPSADREKIERQLAQTAEMMKLMQTEAAFPLYNLHDVREQAASSKAEGSLLPLEVIHEMLEVSITARRLKSFITDRAENYPRLKEKAVALIPLKELEKQIQQVVTEQGTLRNDASPELKRIRRRLNKKRNNLRTTINRVMGRATKKGWTSDEGPTLRGGRMVIPVEVKHKRKIKGFVHDVSSTGQTVYLEPVEALQINNEIRQLEADEKREIERILRELTATVREHRTSIIQNIETLGQFDAITAKARLCNRLNGFVPVISDSSRLYLKDANNPILLLKNSRNEKHEGEPVIPLDLELKPEEQCLVITGPNAGGKSVALKTLGLCVMMMQAGFAIPARDSSELPVYGKLFVDMGDDQSIENDLSTFSSRLAWMKKTRKEADGESLILIDEAAADTDPEEGGALFQAFAEQMIAQKATIIVTTHHGSLKVFANEHPHAVNGSMEFDQASLSPTYRFKKGVPGSSYAFEIAERMNLNSELLGSARRLLGQAKSSMEKLIAELEAKTQEVDTLKNKYDKLRAQTKNERNKYKEKRSGIENEKEAIREKALKEARTIMNTANQRIEEAVEKVARQRKKDSKVIRQAREEVEDHKEKVNRQLEELEQHKQKKERAESEEEPPVAGDLVRLKDGKTTGELEEVSDNNAVVLAGGLRLKTKYKNLVKVKDAKDIKKPKQQVTFNYDRPFVKPSIEIRKMRGPEAMKKVERYLDNAIAAGRHEVDIIHGKGEGILKHMVHEYLDAREEVKEYRIAPLARGGAGCTIVKL